MIAAHRQSSDADPSHAAVTERPYSGFEVAQVDFLNYPKGSGIAFWSMRIEKIAVWIEVGKIPPFRLPL